MPSTLTYPGVYIEEIPSGVRTIAGVSTAVALFIGRATQGPLKKPWLCLNFTDFARTFGTDTSLGELAHSVRLFFENGGARCYVMRIAKDATAAEVTLKSEGGVGVSVGVLKLTSKNAGLVGETIRALVTYNGQQPEVTFNLEIFRWETLGGQLVKQGRELWPNLTMDPLAARYAPTLVTQGSALVEATATADASASAFSYSQSGRPVAYDKSNPESFVKAWADILGNKNTPPIPAGNHFRISVDGLPYVDIDLSGLNVSGVTASPIEIEIETLKTALATLIEDAIDPALQLGKTVKVSFEDGPKPPTGTLSHCLRIASTTGDVFIQPAGTKDLAVPLMLGTAQGGLEVSRYAAARPAPNGIVLKPSELVEFAGRAQNAFNAIAIDNSGPISLSTLLTTTDGSDPVYKDDFGSSATGNNDGVREKLALLQAAINQFAASNPGFRWRAEVWGSRLALLPGNGGDNAVPTISTSGGTNIGTDFAANVARYSLGVGGTAGAQEHAAMLASDGSAPTLPEYAEAYAIVDKEVDLFNLLILPKDADHTESTTASLWGPASVFCQGRRALLLMDGRRDWDTVQQATGPASGVNALRVGLVKGNSALFYPQLLINDNGLTKAVGAGGAIAGLMGRIDGARGVWKAPAGIEADIRGITGLKTAFSDQENGVLNPHGINTLRAFATGIVCWGARTMDGDDDFGSEWKYIPVRRLALFIEESLYRGTQWVVFEPNDNPLWAQIRLNVGAFMNNLFRQGAFQGRTPRDAYFVKCDSETTTQNDINLGVVNILVGFAPLKPAEFVVIKLQQMAGQIQV